MLRAVTKLWPAAAMTTAASFRVALAEADDEAYLAHLAGATGRTKAGAGVASVDVAPPLPTVVRRVRAPKLDVAAVNLAALAASRRAGNGEEGEKSAPADAGALQRDYLALLERNALREAAGGRETAPAGARVTRIRGARDWRALPGEIAVVAFVRGCHPSVADAALSSLDAAAAADSLGFVYYAITDSTTEEVVRGIADAIRAEIPGVYEAGRAEGGAAPVVAVFDRAGSTQRRYILPPSPSAAEVPPPSSDLTAMDAMLLAVAPYPSEISDFAADFAAGDLKPTLIGEARPVGDTYPGFGPFITQVVSSSWEEIVLDPCTDVLLEGYLTNCPMCLCLAPRVRMLGALLYAHGPRQGADGKPLLRVGVMNVDENERPTDWMPGPGFPTLQLFVGAGPATEGKKGKTRAPPVPWSKLHGPGCGACAPASHAALASIGVTSDGAHLHLLPPEAYEGRPSDTGVPPHSHVRSAGGTAYHRLAGKGTPACVPAIDFTHPSQPGKSALPSVTVSTIYAAYTFSSRRLAPPLTPLPLAFRAGAASMDGSALQRAVRPRRRARSRDRAAALARAHDRSRHPPSRFAHALHGGSGRHDQPDGAGG